MKHPFRRFLFSFLLIHFIVSCSKNTEPAPSDSPTNFHGIPPQGTGGDSLLNMKKNRWSAPVSYTGMAIADIINLPNDRLTLAGTEDRIKWSSATASQAAVSEAKAVSVTGYLNYAREEGNESCNGDNNSYHDVHLWITDAPGKSDSLAIVAEATPFWKEHFPSWQINEFTSLASAHTQVRISGWIMWDEDHPEQIGVSRASLWEIHPMTKFEYYSGGVWQVLQ